MRIGIVTGEYPPMQGGVGAYSQILARHLAGLGHTIHVFTDQQAAEEHQRIHIDNHVRRWNRATLRRLKRWAEDADLDIVNLQFETAAFGMSPWVHFLPGMLKTMPVVTNFHDLLVPYLFPKAGPLREWIVLHLARTSAGVIATNREDMLRLNHLPHVTLIPIGSNIPTALPDDYDRRAWRQRAGAGDDDFLLAHFGFLNRSKGVDILLEDIAALRRSHICPVKLVMIGGRTGSSDPANAAYAAEIDAQLERLGLAPIVHWTGFVDEQSVSAYLTASDVVVLPFRDGASFRRGSLMAAIQHGCAIITTEPKVYVSEFKDGENMLFVRPETLDPDVPPFFHTTHQILQLYRSAALREQLREGARQLTSRFDWENIALRHIAFFDEILKGRR